MIEKLHKMATTLTRIKNGSFTRDISLSNTLKARGIQLQQFKWNPYRQATFVGAQNTKILLPAHAMLNTNGLPVTGTVDLKLIELYSRADMLCAGRTSSSEDRLLHNGAQLYFQAFQHGEPLVPCQPIQIELGKSGFEKPNDWSVFIGSTGVTRPFGGAASFDWKACPSCSTSFLDLSSPFKAVFTTKNLGWLQLARPMSRKNDRTMVSVRYQTPLGPLEEKFAFLVFEKSNTLAKMYAQGRQFTAFNLPEKKAATIIVLGRRKHNYFMGAQFVPHLQNRMTTVQLEVAPIEKIMAFIKPWEVLI